MRECKKLNGVTCRGFVRTVNSLYRLTLVQNCAEVLLTRGIALACNRRPLTVGMTEVWWCVVEVMQSACVVSRLFTLLIALVWVAVQAGTCCCSWSRDLPTSERVRACYTRRVATAAVRPTARSSEIDGGSAGRACAATDELKETGSGKTPTRRRTNKWTRLNDDLWAGHWTDCDTSSDWAAWRLTMYYLQSTRRPLRRWPTVSRSRHWLVTVPQHWRRAVIAG